MGVEDGDAVGVEDGDAVGTVVVGELVGALVVGAGVGTANASYWQIKCIFVSHVKSCHFMELVPFQMAMQFSLAAPESLPGWLSSQPWSSGMISAPSENQLKVASDKRNCCSFAPSQIFSFRKRVLILELSKAERSSNRIPFVLLHTLFAAFKSSLVL